MNSCVTSYCMCFRKVSCASGISASWPIAGVPRPCHSVFSCSIQRLDHKPSRKLPQSLLVISGFAPSAVARWRPSSGLLPPKSHSALHLFRSQLPHETTIHITKSLPVPARAISLCFAVLHIWPFPLFQSLFPRGLAFHPTQERPPLSAAPQGNIPTQLDTTPPSDSIPIGPASAAITDGFLQVAVSKARPSTLPSHHPSVDARFRYSTRTCRY